MEPAGRCSATSGPLAWMLSNVISTIWIHQRQRRRRQKRRGPTANLIKEKSNENQNNSVFVDDQEKALRFYTEVLGFAKKADFSNGPYRWLTVASPEDPDGTELQLALNNNPAAKAYQQAIFQQGQPAAMFFTDDVEADYQRMKARGAEFTMPPKDVTASKIAMLKDTCGNIIQVTQLARY
jgi:predicted enzyme related to lactoylglutathione lyase